MTLRVSCPRCGQALALDNVRSGGSIRCPACDGVFSATSLGRSEGIATVPQPRGSAPRRSESSEPARRRPAREAGSGASTAALILGIIALVLGVPALAISWVPFLCIVGVVTAAIGLLVGVVALVIAGMHKGEGLGVSLAGGIVNLLALMVALFMTFVSGALMASLEDEAKAKDAGKIEGNRPQAGPRGGNLLAGWGQKVDPNNDCTFIMQGASLDVRVPPTPHDLSAELGLTNAPRVLQEVTGDFTVQVKVCGSLRPTAPAAIQGRVPFQAGGLLLWSDERNYLRLERAGINRNGVFSSYAGFELRANGFPKDSYSMDIPDQDTYLRLERRGNEFWGFVSRDGQQWRPHQRINAALPDRVQVGVAVVNAAQQRLPVRFEGLRLDKK
ncbi:MAG TPA: DUF1349 domain-containing protein [Gemmataceae bacterium]|nr:DUF1349 domain-containing protein [Gemmataceae bacterium]